jgi:hypothetical protein
LSFTTELKVPPDLQFVSLVESFVADAARRAELTGEQRGGVVTAAGKAFAAIVKEALADAPEPLRLVAECTPLHLTVALFERGLPVDDALARRHPGWHELCADVDSAHWYLHGTSGSELRLRVNRSHGLVPEVAGPQIAPREEEVPLAAQQEYVIRRFQPADAAGVARAFYLTYGYAYDLAAVYVPARLIELNANGTYVSTVAVTAGNDVVGHYALSREADEPIADGCGALVLPAHRGRNLLNRLRDRVEEEAIALGLAAYYSEPVTDHPRTQHASESFGAKACGITLAEAPRNFIARHMELSATSQRQSCMLYMKPLRAREPRAIYAPPHHRTIIEKVYEQLGLPIVISDGSPPNAAGRFHQGVSRTDGTGAIVVETVGSQTAQLVRQAVSDLRASRRLGAIYASLPLEAPGTPALCEAMESDGFFFSGVGPWMLGGSDALRLQMLLTPIDLSELVVVGAFGKVLLDYIAAERNRAAARAG